jgi:hypothetical protein
MHTYLKLKFKNGAGKSVFMRIFNPKKGLTKDTVLAAMQGIVVAAAFKKNDTALYAVPVAASYVTTTEDTVVEEQVN